MSALAGGGLAAQAIQARLRGEKLALLDYARQWRAFYGEYLAARKTYYALEKRWPDAPFWRRRAALPETVRA